MPKRANGNRHERARYYQLRDAHRNRHSDKEYKQQSNRTERHTVAQLCHQACLDPEVDTFYNKRADWDHFSRHYVPYFNWWYTARPAWMRNLVYRIPGATLEECKHLPQWQQHQVHQNLVKLGFYVNREIFSEEQAARRKAQWQILQQRYEAGEITWYQYERGYKRYFNPSRDDPDYYRWDALWGVRN